VPFDALTYLTGECNYGGRVTDKHDRRTLATILDDYYCESIFDDTYKFSPSGKYFAPSHGEFEKYIEYAKSIDAYPEPEIFGLHANAAITKNINETSNTLASIMTTQQNSGGGGAQDTDAMVKQLADKILTDLPEAFDLVSAQKKYAVDYEQSLNTVLT